MRALKLIYLLSIAYENPVTTQAHEGIETITALTVTGVPSGEQLKPVRALKHDVVTEDIQCLSPAKITDLREDGWKKVLEEAEEEMKGSRLETVECFVTGDVREGRGGEKWLNAVGRKVRYK